MKCLHRDYTTAIQLNQKPMHSVHALIYNPEGTHSEHINVQTHSTNMPDLCESGVAIANELEIPHRQ